MTAADSRPVVATVMLKAFNHERFIEQAIESALAQVTSFRFEVLVGEDCSTDGTRAIVSRIAEHHRDVVRLLDRSANVGMVQNTIDLYTAARGCYVAWLDGDDYWISTDKLQRQVMFLESHPEVSACVHEAVVVGPDGCEQGRLPSTPPRERYNVEHLLGGSPAATGTWMFRRQEHIFPEWFDEIAFSDWPLLVLHAERGPVAWMPGLLAAYRVRAAGPTAVRAADGDDVVSRSWADNRLAIYERLDRHFGGRYRTRIDVERLKLGGGGRRISRALGRWPALRRRVAALAHAWPTVARMAVGAAERLGRQHGGGSR